MTSEDIKHQFIIIIIRIAKQDKCHQCCSCKNYRGMGMEGKKRYFRHFLADQFVEEKEEKKAFWGIL